MPDRKPASSIVLASVVEIPATEGPAAPAGSDAFGSKGAKALAALAITISSQDRKSEPAEHDTVTVSFVSCSGALAQNSPKP